MKQLGLMFSAVASPASHSAQQASEGGSATPDGSGPSTRESSKTRARRSSLAKTCHGCARLDCPQCWPILPASGSMSSGLLSEHPTLGRRMSATGSGLLLPTPTACSYGTNQGGSAGRRGPQRASLQTMARHGTLPTPLSRDWKGPTQPGDGSPSLGMALGARRPTAKLPTPTVKGNYNRKGASATSGDGLATAVGGTLHPRFVEWMLGAPKDWTACLVTPTEARAKRAMMNKRRTPGESPGSGTP